MSEKIIIIDDDQVYSNSLMFRILTMGYRAETANGLNEAVMKIKQAEDQDSPFSVAVVDMKFAISNVEQKLGKEIINYLKDNYPNIACILSSADSMGTLELQDLMSDYNIDYCLPKHDIDVDTFNKAIVKSLKHVGINKKNGKQNITIDFPNENISASSQNEINSKRETTRKVFISYSHRDEEFKDELLSYLSSLRRQGIIDVWQDREIKPGDEWNQSIQIAMDECQIALLLVSVDFLNSEFILGRELPALFQRRKNQGLRAVPIIVRECLWQEEPVLKDLQALPKDGRPVKSFSRETGDREKVWTDIVKAIERVAKNR